MRFIWLQKNPTIRKISKKIIYVKVKPFFIKNKEKINNYVIKLSQNTKIYFLFYVLLL